MAPKLILTGFMATGKSVVARTLARRLGWRMIDCDAEIVARAGKPIAQIFRQHGEDHFRALERGLIAEIADDPRQCAHCGQPRPAVVATGGGAIVDAENYAAMQRAGVIVCLLARPEIIAKRIGPTARTRPMLMKGGKPLNRRIAELIETRRAAYMRATITIDTSDLTIDEVADLILTAFAAHKSQPCTASA
jgi:shikimate kinase